MFDLRRIKHCRICGAPAQYRVPADDNRDRAICTACGEVHYENPLNVVGTVPVWGEQVLLGQISLVGPDADPDRPPDPATMEARLRQGLAELDPQLAALPGHYRQVPVPFCSDGQPLAGPVDGAPPGLWAFSGFSGAFTAVPPLAETLAESVAASLAGPLNKKADRINHGGATPL